MSAIVDPRAAEELLALPIRIPVRPLEPIPAQDGTVCLARFNPPRCDNMRPFGIDFDLPMTLAAGADPNEILLHELVHAWQWACDPEGFATMARREIAEHGYEDASHEVEARELAAKMLEAGVRVWFPERAALG
jgi:hypothetical protein